MTCALAKKDLERRSLRMVGLLNGATGLSKSQLGSTGATPIGRRVAIALIVSSSDNSQKGWCTQVSARSNPLISESRDLVPVYPAFYPLQLVLQLA